MTLLKEGNRRIIRNNRKYINFFKVLRSFTQRFIITWEKLLKGTSYLNILENNC